MKYFANTLKSNTYSIHNSMSLNTIINEHIQNCFDKSDKNNTYPRRDFKVRMLILHFKTVNHY